MDADRFDALLRSLFRFPSRRSALRLLAGLLLGSPLALGITDADANDTLKKCKKIKDKRKKCVKTAKKHNATHATEPPVTSPSCTPTAPAKPVVPRMTVVAPARAARVPEGSCARTGSAWPRASPDFPGAAASASTPRRTGATAGGATSRARCKIPVPAALMGSVLAGSASSTTCGRDANPAAVSTLTRWTTPTVRDPERA
jgi:hypothetical protein